MKAKIKATATKYQEFSVIEHHAEFLKSLGETMLSHRERVYFVELLEEYDKVNKAIWLDKGLDSRAFDNLVERSAELFAKCAQLQAENLRNRSLDNYIARFSNAVKGEN